MNVYIDLFYPDGMQREIKVKRQKVDTVTSFRYLGGSCFTSWLKTRSSIKDCTCVFEEITIYTS